MKSPVPNPAWLLADDRWRYALIGGVLSIPLTTIGYWQSGSELSLSPVLLGGLVAGYLASRSTGESRGVGFRAGLIGSLPALWILVDILGASSALDGPTWFLAAGIALTIGAVVAGAVFAVFLSALLGEFGGRIGGWLAGSNGSSGNSVTRG